MAWRSSGNNNDDMVNNLTRFGVITTPAVEEAFRTVDRRFFVPQSNAHLAHTDQPLKEGNVHISAPHIYGSIVEALDLKPNSPQSFLNIGSGTGYLSCIVGQIIGANSGSSCYGVDIHQDVVDHCKASLLRWQQFRRQQLNTDKPLLPSMEFVCGNGLEIQADKGECQFGFDRIYIGASVQRSQLSKIANLLRPGGVLVGPVDDDLVKVTRIHNSSEEQKQSKATSFEQQLQIPRSLHGRAPALSEDFSFSVLSAVRFAPLVRNPPTPTVIPCRIWEPSVHHHYPNSFRKCIKEIMLCSHAPTIQPKMPVEQKDHINPASMLPKDVWMKVLSYTHSSWFEQPHKFDESFLRQRLREEQRDAIRAREECAEAERRLRLAERERDGYKLLAQRWQAQLKSLLSEGGNANAANRSREDNLLLFEDIQQAAESLLYSDRNVYLQMRALGFGRRRITCYSSSESEDDDDEGEEEQNDDDNDDGFDNMEAETENGDEENNAMDDSTSEDDEDDSEASTLAASPPTATSTGSGFYQQIPNTLQNHAFFK